MVEILVSLVMVACAMFLASSLRRWKVNKIIQQVEDHLTDLCRTKEFRSFVQHERRHYPVPFSQANAADRRVMPYIQWEYAGFWLVEGLARSIQASSSEEFLSLTIGDIDFDRVAACAAASHQQALNALESPWQTHPEILEACVYIANERWLRGEYTAEERTAFLPSKDGSFRAVDLGFDDDRGGVR